MDSKKNAIPLMKFKDQLLGKGRNAFWGSCVQQAATLGLAELSTSHLVMHPRNIRLMGHNPSLIDREVQIKSLHINWLSLKGQVHIQKGMFPLIPASPQRYNQNHLFFAP